MSKLTTTICAALLVAGLAACNRGGGNDDEARLNAAANLLTDNGIYDTSPDDMALNAADLPGDEGGAPANGAGTNATAPAGNAAAGNAQ
jgi:hypothetical protein